MHIAIEYTKKIVLNQEHCAKNLGEHLRGGYKQAESFER